MISSYRLLIGSIGDDSHSVGTTLLTVTFQEAGFFVDNIGILNTLDDFFDRAHDFDAVLISCMNGHADLYLTDFEKKKHQFELTHSAPVAWCLGGNLSVRDEELTVEKYFRRMGFDFVAPKPVSCEDVTENLFRIFQQKSIPKKLVYGHSERACARIDNLERIHDEPLPDALFESLRKEVLGTWPTGADVPNANIKRNHADLSKNFHNRILSNKLSETPLVQPRTGVAHILDQIDLLKYLRTHGLEMASIQLDAATRKKMYQRAQEGVNKTTVGGRSFLNGYPVVTHGVSGIEQIVNALDTPFQIRAGSPDHRLVYEIGLAGGASSVEGGFICYLLPYDKYTSPVESLEYWKYVDKLAHWYWKNHNVVINREYFGPLTCCLIEPVIPICINIVQALLSARSGVRSISVAVAEQGHRSQDIAAVRVLRRITEFYLKKCGFSHCQVSTVYHQYMAAFPRDLDKARQLITESSITGVLSGADRIMTKTHVESNQIPPREANAEGLDLTHKGLRLAPDIKADQARVLQEETILEQEVLAVMQWIETAGGGSFARGLVKAFQEGILDIQFSPSLYNRNELFSARDRSGAIRFINPEKMPFPDELIDFHREKMHQRMTLERCNKISDLMEKDLTRIWKSEYVRWPLDDIYLD